ncbi:MAG: hypothetical protein DWQ08_15070 [Proteobacteria bacterium]|nr:MAG: hypothetical protein DWQ08_15070 [Pseudomonadota bacterium]
MNDEKLNMEIRKFLKKVGIQSQREIEQAVARALAEGTVDGGSVLDANMRLTIPQVGLDVDIGGSISLE